MSFLTNHYFLVSLSVEQLPSFSFVTSVRQHPILRLQRSKIRLCGRTSRQAARVGPVVLGVWRHSTLHSTDTELLLLNGLPFRSWVIGHRRQPEVLWAQRSDKVYLTISLPDARNISVKCEGHGLFSFSAVGKQGESFDCSLELFGPILPERCKTNVGLRNIICSVQKEKKGWWKRLLKSEEKPAPYIKVDWNKWCDEDEEESLSDASDDHDDVYGAGDESSDDEGMLYLPDLEKARGN